MHLQGGREDPLSHPCCILQDNDRGSTEKGRGRKGKPLRLAACFLNSGAEESKLSKPHRAARSPSKMIGDELKTRALFMSTWGSVIGNLPASPTGLDAISLVLVLPSLLESEPLWEEPPCHPG